MKTIALIDDSWEGHHPMYLTLMARTLLNGGHRVIALCPDPEGFLERIRQSGPKYADQAAAFRIETPENSRALFASGRMFGNALRRWRGAGKAVDHARERTGWSPDLVFFPWLDSYLYHGLFPFLVRRIFPFPWSGLYFHPSHLRLKRRFSWIKKGHCDYDVLLTSTDCRSVAVLDEGIVDQLQEKLPGKPVLPFPDFTDTASPDESYALARRVRESAWGRKIVGLLGSLEKRKGLIPLMKLAEASQQETLFYVICGKYYTQCFSDEEKALIARIAGNSNVFFSPEPIPDEASFNALVNACDVIYAVYDRFYHSSNMLTKAALFRKPVLVTEGTCMAERVERFHLGETVPNSEIGGLLSAVKRLVSLPISVERDYDAYYELHSENRLAKILDRVVQSI